MGDRELAVFFDGNSTANFTDALNFPEPQCCLLRASGKETSARAEGTVAQVSALVVHFVARRIRQIASLRPAQPELDVRAPFELG